MTKTGETPEDIYKGDDRDIEVTVKGPHDENIDPAGASARYHIARNVDSVALVTKNSPTIAEVDSTMEITVSLTSSDTDGLDPGKYYHEVEVVDASGKVFTVMTGNLVIKPALIEPA